jgi:outer membrane protein assembly factor BamB
MSDILINRRAFLAIFFVVCIAGVSFGAADGGRRLVSPELLKRGGLEIVWDNKLPINSAEKLERLSIIGGKLYALSSRNYLISLGKDKGETMFGKYAAPVGQPVGEPVVYKDRLIWVLGNRVVTMDERTGDEISSQNIEYGLMCPAVRNSKYMYLSGVDKRLHVLREEGMVQLFEASAGNDSIIKSVIAAENFVIFGTDAGNVISMLAGEPVRLWQFDAAGGVLGRLVLDETSVFFSSDDTNVYRIDMTGAQSVKLAWKYQVAGVPENPPRVAKNAVYQYVREKGLTAVDKESGLFLWSLGDGIELLAEAGSKAYVITKKETLTVMDNRSGSKLYSVNFRGVRRFAFNTGDSKIYVADERGRIACLQPVE